MNGYGDDLAYIHDVGFGWFATGAAPGLLEILRQHGVDQGHVVDLGCGSGLWARELVRAGYGVTGIDQSAAMLRLARQRAPAARFNKGSFLSVKLPSCDALTSMGECLCYLFDGRNGLEVLGRLFRRVYDALRPGGVFIFDVIQPGHGSPPLRGFEGPDWAVVLHVNEEAGILTRRIVTFRKVGRSFRRREETHRVRLYRGPEVAAKLRDAGFRARTVRSYGDFRLLQRRLGFVARK